MSKRNKLLIGTISILVVCIIVTGFTYAYWRLTYQATSVNKIASSCFSMELKNEKNNITLESAYPISDEKGKSLTPYSFTITNTCNLFASYTINLEMLEGTTLSSKYVKTMINNEAITNLNTLETTDTSIEGATESRVLFKGSLGSGDSTDYTLRIWMDSETPFNEDSMNKVFQSKITVTAEVSTYSPVENGFTNLAEALLVNEYQTTSLDIAKNRISSKQNVDLSKTAPLIMWQENHSTTMTTYSFTRVDSSAVGTNGIEESYTQILFGTSYEYDKETGMYNIFNRIATNPADLDFQDNIYYSCGASMGTTPESELVIWNSKSCANMIVITGYDGVADSTLTFENGNTIPTKIYTYNAYIYDGIEIESDKSDKGIYKSIDDYGDTYYYRGSVQNNNVMFANLKWKVIRINGDGSVRLIYNGSDTSSNSYVSYVSFNSDKTDPTYVGYMYSNTLNTSYEDTISNDNDSLIKTILDSWYEKTFISKGYDTYITDSGFCNDRNLISGDGFTANEATIYAPQERFGNYSSVFTCSNMANDLFTQKGNNIGNGKLTYPIGLITVDELAYAGFTSNSLNTMNYLNEPYTYWTMSPYGMSATVQSKMYTLNGVNGSVSNSNTNVAKYARPLINLKADTEISGGIGTANDPFIVK